MSEDSYTSTGDTQAFEAASATVPSNTDSYQTTDYTPERSVYYDNADFEDLMVNADFTATIVQDFASFFNTLPESDGGSGIDDKSWGAKLVEIFKIDTDPSNKDPHKNDAPKIAYPVAGALLGGLVAGAGAGYAAEQKRKSEEETAKRQQPLLDAKTNDLNARLANQKVGTFKYGLPSTGILNYNPASQRKLT